MCLSPKGGLPWDPLLVEGEVSGKPSSRLFSARKPFDYMLGLSNAGVPWPSWRDRRHGVCPVPLFTRLAFSEPEERAGGGPLASHSLRYGLPHRLFVQVVPDYHYQTSHYKSPWVSMLWIKRVMTRQINFFLLYPPPCTYALFHNLHLITIIIIITENKANPQPMQETAHELQT